MNKFFHKTIAVLSCQDYIFKQRENKSEVKMKRIVGLPKKSGASKPKPGLNDIVQSTDKKAADLDAKVAQLDAELLKIKQQLKNAPVGGSTRLGLQVKAKNLLTRKKAYENQAEQLKDKSFNLDSLAMTISSAEDTKVVADVMKKGTKQLRKDLKKVDLDSIEDVQNDLGDLIELTEEVQASLAKNYNVPEEIDDDELNAQLELLGDEIVADNDDSYMDPVINPPTSRKPVSRSRRGGGGGPAGPAAVDVDEFGLPVLEIPGSSLSNSEPYSRESNTNALEKGFQNGEKKEK